MGSCVYEELPSKHLEQKAEARVLNLPPRAFRRRRYPRRLRYPRQHGPQNLGIGATRFSTPRISASAPRFQIDIKHMVVTAHLARHPFQHHRQPRHHRHYRHRATTDVFQPAPFGIVSILDASISATKSTSAPLSASHGSGKPPRHLCTAAVSCRVSIAYNYHGRVCGCYPRESGVWSSPSSAADPDHEGEKRQGSKRHRKKREQEQRGAAASPGAAMYGQPAEVLLEGAEYGAETEDAAGSSDAAAAAGVWPPRLVDWGEEGGGGVQRRSGVCFWGTRRRLRRRRGGGDGGWWSGGGLTGSSGDGRSMRGEAPSQTF